MGDIFIPADIKAHIDMLARNACPDTWLRDRSADRKYVADIVTSLYQKGVLQGFRDGADQLRSKVMTRRLFESKQPAQGD